MVNLKELQEIKKFCLCWDSSEHLFQHIHIMIFIGFGYLMTFLKKYGYSSIGFNFLLGAVMLEWSIVCQGLWQLKSSSGFKIDIGIDCLYQADCATASVLISMGAVLGRTSYIQLLLMGFVELIFYTVNVYINTHLLKISDPGGSVLIHIFGAYFGLAVSYVLSKNGCNRVIMSKEDPLSSTYVSDHLAMIGSLFLWLCWPSFNAVALTKNRQLRAIVNTYLSLIGSCVTAFATSQLLSKDGKFDMVHIQNSTLAGGVAVGAVADLMIQPYGAVLVGMVAGFISVMGCQYLTPIMDRYFRTPDTCKVQFLHGIPGILGGLVASSMALNTNKDTYSLKELHAIYPAMLGTELACSNFTQQSYGDEITRSSLAQAGYQALAIIVTLVVAVFAGIITGFLIKKAFPIQESQHYQDHIAWKMPLEEKHPILAPFIIRKNTKNFDLIV